MRHSMSLQRKQPCCVPGSSYITQQSYEVVSASCSPRTRRQACHLLPVLVILIIEPSRLSQKLYDLLSGTAHKSLSANVKTVTGHEVSAVGIGAWSWGDRTGYWGWENQGRPDGYGEPENRCAALLCQADLLLVLSAHSPS